MESESDAIWAEMPGGGLLKDLFGYWPTLHDARIRTVEIDPSHDGLKLVLEYRDEPDDAVAEIRALIEIEWQGVRSLELDLVADIISIDFKRTGEFITTDLDFGEEGSGRIVATSVDATLSKLDPLTEALPPRLIYRRRA